MVEDSKWSSLAIYAISEQNQAILGCAVDVEDVFHVPSHSHFIDNGQFSSNRRNGSLAGNCAGIYPKK